MFQDCGVLRAASGHYSAEGVGVGEPALKVQNLS